MAATLMPWWSDPFLDTNGNPLAGGSVETYEAGTSTPLATFSDAGLSVSNGTSFSLNAGGYPEVASVEVGVFLLPQAYKFILKNSAGVTVRTRDNVWPAQSAGAGNLDISGIAGEALSANDCCYLSDGSGGLTAGRWYKADADLFYASIHPNIAFATAAIAQGATGTFRIDGVMDGFSGLNAGSTYYISGTAAAITATAPRNARSLGRALSATQVALDIGPAWLCDGTQLSLCDGRLTLTTGAPVTTADVTAATTLYYAPYAGNRIALFDGALWKAYAFTQLSIAVPATTATMYDVFAYDNAGTITLELTAWTNDTTRATALTTQDGVYVKTGALTRRYLGSFRTTGVSGQTEDSFAKRYVWNYYHRVARGLRVLEATDSWTYTTATWRQANGAATNQVDVVIGVAEVPVRLTLLASAANTNANIERFVGIGYDSTTAPVAGALNWRIGGVVTAGMRALMPVFLTHYPAVGRHVYAWLEWGDATGTTTWYGDAGGTNFSQSGLQGDVDG